MSYLSEREIHVTSEDGVEKVVTSSGVPQGSVLGPDLWIVM